jgi:hypothetical protein
VAGGRSWRSTAFLPIFALWFAILDQSKILMVAFCFGEACSGGTRKRLCDALSLPPVPVLNTGEKQASLAGLYPIWIGLISRNHRSTARHPVVIPAKAGIQHHLGRVCGGDERKCFFSDTKHFCDDTRRQRGVAESNPFRRFCGNVDAHLLVPLTNRSANDMSKKVIWQA